eukprot:Gb_25875 [translate_table: standard]
MMHFTKKDSILLHSMNSKSQCISSCCNDELVIWNLKPPILLGAWSIVLTNSLTIDLVSGGV